MNADTMITTLKSLKLFGMADSIADLAMQSSPAFRQAENILNTLLKASRKWPSEMCVPSSIR